MDVEQWKNDDWEGKMKKLKTEPTPMSLHLQSDMKLPGSKLRLRGEKLAPEMQHGAAAAAAAVTTTSTLLWHFHDQ